MHDRSRTALVVVPTLLAVAVLGFLFGRGPDPSVEMMREASTAVGGLDYPSNGGWQPVGHAPALTGLPITRAFALAPKGNTRLAGLMVGRLDSGDEPLPVSFLAHLRQAPTAEVVYLLNSQAYKYSYVNVVGSDATYTLYAIPGEVPNEVVIACYSSATHPSYLQECERIAASFVTFTSARAVFDLTPSVGYMRIISAAVGHVDQLRAALRGGIRVDATAASVQELATRLAAGIESAAASLTAVQPPPAAEHAHAALLEALGRASKAYSAFAVAVGAGSTLEYAAARAQVYAAEARVNTALENFTLLGYR